MNSFATKVCCNPLGLKHKKCKICDLRPVPVWIRNLYSGLESNARICSPCRAKISSQKNKVETDIVYEDDIDFIPKEEALQCLNQCLELIGESKIILKSCNFENYIRTKLEKVKNVILKQIFGYEECGSTELATENVTLAVAVKEVHDCSDKNVKAACAKVLSCNWSNIKIKQELPSSSMYSIKKARNSININTLEELVDKKNTKPTRSVDGIIETFYCNDEYSRIMPGKKDYKSIKVSSYIHKCDIILHIHQLYIQIDGKRILMQKLLLLMNLKELYAEFTKLNPDKKVGFSKFASLRPKQCVLAGSSGTHSVCVCVIHQNFKLMCECVFQKDLDLKK